MNSTIKRLCAFVAAIVICLSTALIGVSAATDEYDQKFWSVFNYNYVYKNMGVEQFKTHWNIGRDTMPLMINFGTQRVGYSDIHIPAFFNEMLVYNEDSPLRPLIRGTYKNGFYLGHGNGFIYAGDSLDVPQDHVFMGHLYQRNTAYVGNTSMSLTVELIYVKGPLTNWNNFDIVDFTFDNYDYEILKNVYRWTIENSDSGGDVIYDGVSDFSYRSRIGGVSSPWKVLSHGDYYGFIFGQTPGSIWNEHMNGSPETIFYSWFEGPFGIDEDTDGMTGQRFGMISPLFYQEGYEAFYDPIYNTGFETGHATGYKEGYDTGKEVGFTSGYEEAVKALDTSQNWANMKNLIFSIFDAPFYVISYSLDFDLFGINVAGTLIALISTALIVWILKIILVKLF